MPLPTPILPAALLAALALAGPAAAEAPGHGYDGPPRPVPRAYRPPHHRDASAFGRPPRRFGDGPTVRAYLPRNDNVPMYNEPPPR